MESATFVPKPGLGYAVKVDGYAIHDEGKFFADETMITEAEKGTLTLSGAAPDFRATYGFSPEATAASALLKAPLYLSKDYSIRGSVTLKTEDGTSLVSIPVTITHP